MRYSVSYDLLAPGKDYQKLYDALVAIGAKRVLLSQWVTNGRANTSAAGIRDYLKQFIDANDRLLVICLESNDWAGWRLMVDPNTV